MATLITGGAGFIGREVVRLLLWNKARGARLVMSREPLAGSPGGPGRMRST